MLGPVPGGGIEVEDGRAQSRGERVADRAGQVELGAAAGLGEDAGPRRKECLHRRQGHDPDPHALAEVQLLGPGEGDRQDRGAGAERDECRPIPERGGSVRWALDPALGNEHEDTAIGEDCLRRRDVLVDADAPAPHRQHPAQSVEEPLAPPCRERRGPAAKEPQARLERQRVEEQEGIHPASMDGRDHEVASCCRDVLAARDRDPKPEHAKQHQPRQGGGDPDQGASLRFRRATQPGQPFSGTAPPSGKGFRREARRGRPRPSGRSAFFGRAIAQVAEPSVGPRPDASSTSSSNGSSSSSSKGSSSKGSAAATGSGRRSTITGRSVAAPGR